MCWKMIYWELHCLYRKTDTRNGSMLMQKVKGRTLEKAKGVKKCPKTEVEPVVCRVIVSGISQ